MPARLLAQQVGELLGVDAVAQRVGARAEGLTRRRGVGGRWRWRW